MSMRRIISMLLTVLLAVGALAQTKTKTVKGVVYEEGGPGRRL